MLVLNRAHVMIVHCTADRRLALADVADRRPTVVVVDRRPTVVVDRRPIWLSRHLQWFLEHCASTEIFCQISRIKLF